MDFENIKALQNFRQMHFSLGPVYVKAPFIKVFNLS